MPRLLHRTPLAASILLSLAACTGDAEHSTPTLSFVSPSTGAVLDRVEATVTVRIADADAAGLRWLHDGDLVLEQNGVVAEGAEASSTYTLNSGSNVLSVEAIGADGSSFEDEVVVFLDAPEAPVLSLLSPVEGAFVDAATVLVQGNLLAGEPPEVATVTVGETVDALVLTEVEEGLWSFSQAVALPPGASTLVVEVEDPAGQSDTVSRSLTRVEDGSPPVFTAVWPTDGHGVRSTATRVRGQVSDNDALATLVLEQGEETTAIEVDPDGTFTVPLDLDRGPNAWRLVATDASGNTMTLDRSTWLGSRVAAGGSHSSLITGEGTLATWGRNNKGQTGLGYTSTLGDVDPAHPASPAPVPLAATPVSVVAFQNATLVLDDEGSLWSFGNNTYGQLGVGTADPDDAFDAEDRLSPTRVASDTAYTTITAGYYHVLALAGDGTVHAFGRNSDGQLGDGGTDATDHPVAVQSLTDVVQVAAASSTSFALTSDGTLYAWGANDYGQLGQGSADDAPHSAPVPIEGLPPIASVAAGRDHVLALDTSGTVHAWGLNASQQVGGIDHGLSDSPILTPSALEHIGPAAAVYANGNQSYIETADGLLWGWGQNGSVGALGITVDGDIAEPIEPVFGVTRVSDVGIGALHSVVLRQDGQAFAWGWSFQGSLGGGDGIIDRWGYRIPILVAQP